MQNTGLKVWKFKTPVLHINSAAYTRIAFLNYWVFDVIFSSTQISQDFKVSNGGPIILADRRIYIPLFTPLK